MNMNNYHVVLCYHFLIIGIIYTIDISAAKFSYHRDECETSILSVIQDMLRNEVQAFLDPRFRIMGSQYIHYDLYTLENPYDRQILYTDDVKALRRSNFNPNWPVRFVVHGWAGKSTSCSNAAIKDAYLSRGNFNVIIVDWSITANDISYPRISQQLSDIAAQLVKFIKFLQSETKLSMDNVYLIGHSAGSHISGLAGKLLKPQILGAIVALDPAGLAQLGLPPALRLAPTDATYVESIHTDIAHMGNPSTELSHASFFPNWGHGQPQCPNATTAEFDFSCDHFASLYYFVESVRNPKLFGAMKLSNPTCLHSFNCTCPTNLDLQSDLISLRSPSLYECRTDTFMGGEPLQSKRGIYYLSTKGKPPFGTGDMIRVRKVREPNFLESSLMPHTPLLLRGIYGRKKHFLF